MNSIVIGINLVKRMLKEINIFAFIFFLPILAATLGILMFGGKEKVILGVANPPKGDYSVVQYLKDSNKYNIEYLEEGNIEEKLNNKEINIGVVFPEDFSLISTSKIKVVTLKDGEEIQILKGEIEEYASTMLSGKDIKTYDKSKVDLKKHEQGKASIGMLSMFIVMFAGSSIGFLLQDKREKNFMRLFSTPVKEYEIVLAHMMANFILGLLQITLFLILTTFIFKIQWGASPWLVYIILIAYLISAVGFSVGLVGIVEDEEKYNLVLTLIAIVTSILGGGFFPTDSLSSVIRKISNFTPQKWMVDSYTILTEGGNINAIRTNLLVLLLFGVVFFTFGVKTLKPGERDL